MKRSSKGNNFETYNDAQHLIPIRVNWTVFESIEGSEGKKKTTFTKNAKRQISSQGKSVSDHAGWVERAAESLSQGLTE